MQTICLYPKICIYICISLVGLLVGRLCSSGDIPSSRGYPQRKRVFVGLGEPHRLMLPAYCRLGNVWVVGRWNCPKKIFFLASLILPVRPNLFFITICFSYLPLFSAPLKGGGGISHRCGACCFLVFCLLLPRIAHFSDAHIGSYNLGISS